MRAAPAVPCAKEEWRRTRAYRAAESIRHSLRNGLTAYAALSPETSSFLPPSPADGRSAQARSGRGSSAGLTPATGARTTRFCRTQPPGFRRVGAGRPARCVRSRTIARPATTTRARRCRVHRNPSLVRDDGQRPSQRDGMGEGCNGDLGVGSRIISVKQKNFLWGDLSFAHTGCIAHAGVHPYRTGESRLCSAPLRAALSGTREASPCHDYLAENGD